MQILTSDQVANAQIIEDLGVISERVVVGSGFITELFAGISDIFGGRSSKLEKRLHELYDLLLMKIERKARSMKADAVISLKMDFDEISGKNKQLFMVTGYGTAVRLSQNNNEGVTQVYGLGARVKDQLNMNKGCAIVNDYLEKYESGDSDDLWRFSSVMEQLLAESMKIVPEKLLLMLYYKTKSVKGSVPVLAQEAADKFADVLSNSIEGNEDVSEQYFSLNRKLISADSNAFSCPENKDIYLTIMSDYLETNYRNITENLNYFPQCIWDRMFFKLILKGQERRLFLFLMK